MTEPAPTPSKDTRALVRVLDRHEVTVVLDVGANVGQYARRLRQGGWSGRIVSFEPLPAVHAGLTAAAAGDPAWEVPAPLALGDRDGELTLNISAESDMSSALPFRPEMAELLDSAGYRGTTVVPLRRLDGVFPAHVRDGDRPFLKIDTQGFEPAVLDGAQAVLDRLVGLQMELALVPVYEGEIVWQAMIAQLAGLGFQPVLFFPGYFNRRTARLMSMDGIFIRRDLLDPLGG
jgi:FkbM family methyltransferase